MFKDTIGRDDSSTRIEDTILGLLVDTQYRDQVKAKLVKANITDEFFTNLFRKQIYWICTSTDAPPSEVKELFYDAIAKAIGKTSLSREEFNFVAYVMSRAVPYEFNHVDELIRKLIENRAHAVNITRFRNLVAEYERGSIDATTFAEKAEGAVYKPTYSGFDYTGLAGLENYTPPEHGAFPIFSKHSTMERMGMSIMPGEYCHVTGVTKGRKTTMALVTARNALNDGLSVTVLTTEMSRPDILSYLLSMEYHEFALARQQYLDAHGKRMVFATTPAIIRRDMWGKGEFFTKTPIRRELYQMAFERVKGYASRLRVYDGNPDSDFQTINLQTTMDSAFVHDQTEHGPSDFVIVDHIMDTVPAGGGTSDYEKQLGGKLMLNTWRKRYPQAAYMVLSQMGMESQRNGSPFTTSGASGGNALDTAAVLSISAYGHFADKRGKHYNTNYFHFAITAQRWSGNEHGKGVLALPIHAGSGYVSPNAEPIRASQESPAGDSGESD